MEELSSSLEWDTNMLYSLQGWVSPPASPTNEYQKCISTAPVSSAEPASLSAGMASPAQLLYRFGQITPSDDNISPDDSSRGSASSKTDPQNYQSFDATLWPLDNIEPPTQPNPLPLAHSQAHSVVRDESNGPKQTHPSPQQDLRDHMSVAAVDSNAPPTKRRRGRPKRQPQSELTSHDLSSSSLNPTILSARATHLEKNRVAAHKCRQRQKESEKALERTAKEASNKNKLLKAQVNLLKEEVLGLKNEVLGHAGCGFWAVDQYLARCAGDWLGRERSGSSTVPPRASSVSILSPSPLMRKNSGDTAVGTSGTPPEPSSFTPND